MWQKLEPGLRPCAGCPEKRPVLGRLLVGPEQRQQEKALHYKGFESSPAYVKVGWGSGLPCLP